MLPTIPLDSGADLADLGRTPLEALQQQETHDEVLAALRALPEHERAATALFYIDGYSMAEVGEFLEVPVSTVKSRLHAARRRMQERMVGVMEEAFKQRAPGDELGRRVRQVLEGVPSISFKVEPGKGPESLSFPASLRACMQFLGEDPAYDYAFHLGTSGAAFGVLWSAGKWWYNGDLTDLALNAAWEEPIRRAFAAVGYRCELVAKVEGAEGERDYRRRIVASIKRGLPVLAAGVVGPPSCTIVTGYDEDGDVLTGWSHFQAMIGHNPANEFEESGYFRKRGWFPDAGNLIVIGEKVGAPPLAEAYRQALAWVVQLMRTPEVQGRLSGLAAYTAWAEDLLRDQDFPADDGVLMERLDSHFGTYAVVAEGRWYAGQFLKRAAEKLPAMAEELHQAAACCDQVAGLMMQVTELQGGFDPHSVESARRLGDPAIRRQMVPLILQARDLDAQAAEHINRALAL